jgi:hypothetical protein
MSSKTILGVSGLIAFVAYCFHRGQCAKAVKTEVKQDLGRWEGEGGNVPAVATPSPVPPPAQSSYPGNGSGARH